MMGESKERRRRLGVWYGKDVVPGHPDFKEPAPAAMPRLVVPQLAEVLPVADGGMGREHAEIETREPLPEDVVTTVPAPGSSLPAERPRPSSSPRRMPRPILAMAMLSMALAASVDVPRGRR
jgi:hypothetical protein